MDSVAQRGSKVILGMFASYYSSSISNRCLSIFKGSLGHDRAGGSAVAQVKRDLWQMKVTPTIREGQKSPLIAQHADLSRIFIIRIVLGSQG